MARRRLTPFRLDEAAGVGIYPTDEGYQYGLERDPDVPGVEDFGAGENRKRLEAVYGQVNAIYDDLVRAGETERAFMLRDAADKFRRTGSKLGVNRFRRVRALKDLETALDASAASTRSQLARQRLGELRSTIGQLSQLSDSAFSRGMQRAHFRETKLASLRGRPEPTRAVTRRVAAPRRARRTTGRRLTPGAQRLNAMIGANLAAADRLRRTGVAERYFRESDIPGTATGAFYKMPSARARAESLVAGFGNIPAMGRRLPFAPSPRERGFTVPGRTLTPGTPAAARIAARRAGRPRVPAARTTARPVEFTPIPGQTDGFGFRSPTTVGEFRRRRLTAAGRRVS